MTKPRSTLIGPPLIGSWVPYLAGREYRHELYDLFLYDGQILHAMYPAVSDTASKDITWVSARQVFPDRQEPPLPDTPPTPFCIPHQYIVAVRLMSDNDIRQQRLIWPTGVARQAQMTQAFLYRTTGRRYTRGEIYRIAKDIRDAINTDAEQKCVLSILKTRFRDVIDK